VVERLNALSDDSNLVASQLRLILNQRLVRKLCANCSGKGCADCFGSGLRGRVPFLEMLRLDEANQGAIEAKQLAKLEPDLSFEQSRENLLGQALTTETEINRHLHL
jgi:type II secretory ATPase GspE/PulE/Tfp pilus assembly ATPase PilB-like protein